MSSQGSDNECDNDDDDENKNNDLHHLLQTTTLHKDLKDKQEDHLITFSLVDKLLNVM